jgi:hypothetical protein
VVFLALLAGPLVVAVLAAGVGRGGPGPALPAPRLRSVARTTRRWRLAGLALGVALGVYAVQNDRLGRGLMLFGPLIALGVVVGVVVGELRVVPPSGPTRTAALEVRRVRDYLPRVLAPVVAGATLTLSGLLVLTTATGAPDDLGRPGRDFVTTCSTVMDGVPVRTTAATGPWPGSFYSLPLAAAVGGGLLAAAVALRAVARRPRQGEDHTVDETLRRYAVSDVVAAVGVLVAWPLAGVAGAAAAAVQGSCATGGWRVLAVVLFALVPVGLAVTLCCGSMLARPRRPWPAPAGRTVVAP